MKFSFKSTATLFALVVSTTLIFSSCKKDKSEAFTSTKLKSVTAPDNQVSLTYNANGTIKTAALKNDFVTSGDLVNYQVSYNAQGKISEITSDEDIRIVPIYQNGVLAEASFETLSGIELFVTTYTYQNNFLKSVQINSAAGEAWLKFVFTNSASGNVEKTEFYFQNPLQPDLFIFGGTVTSTYDNKPNPLYAAKDLLHLLWVPASPNNMLTEIHKDDNNILEETVNYTYQYHSNGVPKSAVMQSTVVGQQPVNSAITFSYF
ncbi:hypothetical protein [Lacibacter sediminis]|uniref:DUF4595 domain-containing protein n=1 Tax=Lacibacter sediminis TaxID=2760713 RepID=A0A7G5XD32_9BACT|nr:hypothetical protein [Lacibacter sediminis]QNA43385.1 hypothetical protein H4075_15020 [Lacibacter sediminis]